MADRETIIKRVSYMGHSLIDEGYRIIFNVGLPETYYIKLRHCQNGNVISIVGNYEKSLIRLFRNGKLRHEEKL